MTGMRKAIDQDTLQALIETGAAREFRLHAGQAERAGRSRPDSGPSGCQYAHGVNRCASGPASRRWSASPARQAYALSALSSSHSI